MLRLSFLIFIFSFSFLSLSQEVQERPPYHSKLLDQTEQNLLNLISQAPWFLDEVDSFSGFFIKNFIVSPSWSVIRSGIEYHGSPISEAQAQETIKNFFIENIEKTSVNDVRSQMSVQSSKGFQLFYKPNGVIQLPIGRNNEITEAQAQGAADSIKGLIESKNITELAINITENSPHLIMSLAEIIKEKDIKIHVLGFCSNYCASYILPVAQSITISPYGYIDFAGSHSFFWDEYQKVFDQEKQAYQDHIQKQGGFAAVIQKSLTDLDGYGDLIDKIISDEKYSSLLPQIESIPFDDHQELPSESSAHSFAQKIMSSEKKLWLQLFYDLNQRFGSGAYAYDQKIDFMNHLARLKEREAKLFEGLNLDTPHEVPFSFMDFLKMTNNYTKKGIMNVIFPNFNYQRTGSFVENSKPTQIFPSSDLMIKMGLNLVKGENNKLDLGGENKWINIYHFYVDEEKIKECQLMSDNPNQKILQQCFDQDRLGPLTFLN